ncbi:MAG: (d)CMP kinase [Alphaproteobacteria bacterium]
MIVAVDGPSASGKGTLARRLAAALDFAYLDTGLLYRAVGAAVLAAGGDPSEPAAAAAAARNLDPTALEPTPLRREAVARAASVVAAIPEVRADLRDLQRRFAAAPPGAKAGAVLDGRDIGTVVCPQAEVKIFVTASAEERARRRHKELLERGEASIYARVMTEMRERDRRDSERAVSPLKPAEDAEILDTSALGVDEAFQAALEIIEAKCPGLTVGTRTTS